MKVKVCKGNYEGLGVERKESITNFSVENREGKTCNLVLYPKNEGKCQKIPMKEEPLRKAIYSVSLRDMNLEEYDYNFEIDGMIHIDPYAKKITGREVWADKSRKPEQVKSCFYANDFPWKNDVFPNVLKEEMILYKLHVRGFSMGLPQGTKERGTIAALEKKIRYFKEIGITTLELMPVYEFEEIYAFDKNQKETFSPDKVNYWGYTKGNYFAPKEAYLKSSDSPYRLKQFIQKLHQNQMECIMEFYFNKNENPIFVLEILRYWVKEYHVDGFHLLCDKKTAHFVARDIYLSGRKLFYEYFPEDVLENETHEMELFTYNEGFTYAVRKMINGQDVNLGEFLNQMRRQDENQGFVNFISSNNGFTLYDLFSYSQKYNDKNGEENQDGSDWNYSSNCGEEGVSRKKNVNRFRLRQIKNALSTVFLSQGVPLIWMGDENGNSQLGNNNAYCQDNVTGWKSWQSDKKSKDILSFTKQLLKLRSQHPVLHSPVPMRMEDYSRVGFPDLSYHGEKGWRFDFDREISLVGLLYCGSYAKEQKEEYVYVGYNFSQTAQQLALPDLPQKMIWSVRMDTGAEETFRERVIKKKEDRIFTMKNHSVCLMVGIIEEVEDV